MGGNKRCHLDCVDQETIGADSCLELVTCKWLAAMTPVYSLQTLFDLLTWKFDLEGQMPQ